MFDRLRFRHQRALEAMSAEQWLEIGQRAHRGIFRADLVMLVVCGIIAAIGGLRGALWPVATILWFSCGAAEDTALRLFWRTGRPVYNFLRNVLRYGGMVSLMLGQFYYHSHTGLVFVYYFAVWGIGAALVGCLFPTRMPFHLMKKSLGKFGPQETVS